MVKTTYMCGNWPAESELRAQLCYVLTVDAISAIGSADGGRDVKMLIVYCLTLDCN
jgi:hypothetical protein